MADEQKKRPRVFEDGWIGKALLMIIDKVLLATVVILLLDPLQAGMKHIQKRHDKATQIGDLLVDKALESLGRLGVAVADYTAAVQLRMRGGNVDAANLVAIRTKIDTEINMLRAYVGTPKVNESGMALASAVQDLNRLTLVNQLEREQANPKTAEVTAKAYRFTKDVVDECRTIVQGNIDAAYQ